MTHTITIQEDVLRQLLEDESTTEEALDKYFELDSSVPFNPKYAIRSGVNIIPSEVQVFGVMDPLVAVANGISRHIRLQRYKKSIKEHPDRPRIVSEGDSWFQHPIVPDTIDHLLNYFSVYSLGAAGDEFTDMFRENEYLPALKKQDAKILLLSGGGNDLLAKNLPLYFEPFSDSSNEEISLTNEFHAKVRDILNLYQSTFELVKMRLPEVRIFTHGYDYVIPRTGRKGKWLGRALSKNGYSESDTVSRKNIVSSIIHEFNERMTGLCAGYDHVCFIDVRGTVRETQWYDEIHPNSDGFGQVANKFIDALNKIK